MNLELYDQYKRLERGEGIGQHRSGMGEGGMEGGPLSEGGASRAYGNAVAATTTPLRKNALQQSVYKDGMSTGIKVDGGDLIDDGPGP